MVSFKTKKIKNSSTIKRKYTKRKYKKSKKTFTKILLKILLFLVLFGTLWVLVAGTVLYYKMIEPLPPVTKLKRICYPSNFWDLW